MDATHWRPVRLTVSIFQQFIQLRSRSQMMGRRGDLQLISRPIIMRFMIMKRLFSQGTGHLMILRLSSIILSLVIAEKRIGLLTPGLSIILKKLENMRSF